MRTWGHRTLAAEQDDQILMGAGMDTYLLAEANARGGLGDVRHPRNAPLHAPIPLSPSQVDSALTAGIRG